MTTTMIRTPNQQAQVNTATTMQEFRMFCTLNIAFSNHPI